MSTQYDDAIVDFLSKEVNLPYALEIGEYIGTVSEKLYKYFWDKVKADFDKRLNGVQNQRFRSEFRDHNGHNFDHKWFGLIVFPDKTGNKSNLVYQISQDIDDHQWVIWYGITTRPHNALNTFKHSDKLFETARGLVNHGNIAAFEETDRWIGKQTTYAPTKNRFLIDALSLQSGETESKRASETASKIVENAWKIFEVIQGHLVEINEANMDS